VIDAGILVLEVNVHVDRLSRPVYPHETKVASKTRILNLDQRLLDIFWVRPLVLHVGGLWFVSIIIICWMETHRRDPLPGPLY
jgi:hypothetical protein